MAVEPSSKTEMSLTLTSEDAMQVLNMLNTPLRKLSLKLHSITLQGANQFRFSICLEGNDEPTAHEITLKADGTWAMSVSVEV